MRSMRGEEGIPFSQAFLTSSSMPSGPRSSTLLSCFDFRIFMPMRSPSLEEKSFMSSHSGMQSTESL